MPGSALNVAAIVSQLNEVNVKRGIYQQYDTHAFCLDVLDKGDQGNAKLASMLAEVDGRFVTIHGTFSGNPNTAIGVREGRSYPQIGSQSRNPIKFKSVRLLSALGQTSEALSRSATDKQSILRVHASEMEMLMKQQRRKVNGYMLSDGSGAIEALPATAWAQAAGGYKMTIVNPFLYEIGMELSFRNPTTGALATLWPLTSDGEPYPVKVTAIDYVAKTITLKYYNDANVLNSSAADFATTAFNGMVVYYYDMQGYAPWGLKNMTSTVNPSRSGWNPAATPPADEDGRNMTKAFGSIDRLVEERWKAIAARDLAGAQATVKEHIEPLEAQLVAADGGLMPEGSVIALSDQERWQGITHELEAGRRTTTRTRIVDNRYEVVKSGIFLFCFDPMMPKNADGTGDFLFFPPALVFNLLLTAWQMEIHDGVSKTQLTTALGRLKSTWQQNLETERNLVVARCNTSSQFNNAG